jgi:putative intracellular protease/amidase
LFYASAGHAALIDYPHAKNIQKIASDVWNKGGIVSSVYTIAIFLVREDVQADTFEAAMVPPFLKVL